MVAVGLATGMRPSSLRPLRRKGATPDVLWDRNVEQLPPGKMRDSELLFPPDIGGFRSASCLDKPFADVSKHIAMKKHLTPRAMRRAFQDLARAAEVKDVVTRAVSGHATEEMQRHCSTVNQLEIRNGLAKVISLGGFSKAMEQGSTEEAGGGRWCA
jgi:hypothetical protein